MPTFQIIFTLRRTRRMPEVRPVGLINTCPRANNIKSTKLSQSNIKHVCKSPPQSNVSFDKNSSGRLARLLILRNEDLGFRAQRKIGYDNIAVPR